MTIDLRKEFSNITRLYGHNIYLQRRIYNRRDDIPEEVKGTTNFYSPKLEKYTVRYRLGGRIASLTGVAEERIEGIIHTVDRAYFFPHYAHPAEGDRIYQPDPRYEDKMEIFLIDYALAMRGWRGRIEYWEAGVTRENPS